MHSVMRVTVAATVLGISALSLTVSAHAGNGSALGAGIVGFGVGAMWETHSRRKRCMSLRRRPSITRHLHLFMSRLRPCTSGRPTMAIPRIEAIAANYLYIPGDWGN